MSTIALIDLSAIFRSFWHALSESEVNEAARRTVERVRKIADKHDHSAVCVDRPPYLRRQIADSYKAQREKASNVMIEQLKQAEAQIDADGLHLFGVEGYEADDIIGELAGWSVENDHEAVIYSADKDLMQCVGPSVTFVSTSNGNVYDAAAVKEAKGVHPELIPDLLAICGDKSDGIQGIKGVGPVTASKWLNEFDGLEGVLANVHDLEPSRFRVVVDNARDQLGINWKLTQLIPVEGLDCERVLEPKEPKTAAPDHDPMEEDEMSKELGTPDIVEPEIMEGAGVKEEGAPREPATVGGSDGTPAPAPPHPGTAIVAAPDNWQRALEPRNTSQAWGLAKLLHESRMFGDWPTPNAIMACVMTGRMYGMDAVSSLRGFHNIQGKMAPSSMLLIGLVKRNPLCKYFRLTDSTDEFSAWETLRVGEPESTTLTFTAKEAQMAGYLPGKSGSQWQKQPKMMLRWRCGVNLARAVYPDIVAGLYSIEELLDIREEQR